MRFRTNLNNRLIAPVVVKSCAGQQDRRARERQHFDHIAHQRAEDPVATARRRGIRMCMHRGVPFKVFKRNSYAPAMADRPCSTTSTQGKPASHLLWLISLCLLPLFECAELRLDVRRRQRRLVQIDHTAKTRDVADHENSLIRDHDIL